MFYRAFSSAIQEVVDCLYDYMVEKYIKFPSNAEALAEKELFIYKGSLKQVWAVVDGTHILVHILLYLKIILNWS